MRVVVDTCIFNFAFLDQGYEELQDQCFKTIDLIKNDDNLSFAVNTPNDELDNYCMDVEYRNKLGGIRDFEVFWTHMYENDKVKRVDISYDETIKKDLYLRGFIGKEDYIFVETALASDRCLVTEDSDYGVHGEEDKKNAYEYITNSLKIILFYSKLFNEKNGSFKSAIM